MAAWHIVLDLFTQPPSRASRLCRAPLEIFVRGFERSCVLDTVFGDLGQPTDRVFVPTVPGDNAWQARAAMRQVRDIGGYQRLISSRQSSNGLSQNGQSMNLSSSFTHMSLQLSGNHRPSCKIVKLAPSFHARHCWTGLIILPSARLSSAD